MVISALQCTENQPILTYISSGTATIPLQQNTLWWAHYIIGARAVCSNPQWLKKEENHLQRVLQENKYPIWLWTGWKWRSMHPQIKTIKEGTKTPMSILHLATRGPTLWFHMLKGLVRAWKTYAEDMEYKCIVKEVISSKASQWLPRIKTPSQRRVV